ncbi:MAG: alpha/beta hydrolase [Saprospiraceae bacterium]|nr:alpha/beta hydrolase [Saprospiraceae bacterium]
MYFFLALLATWRLAVQAGCLAMRTPDAEWQPTLRAKGQTAPPVFLDVSMPAYRNIHAVYVGDPDSLPLVLLVHGSPGSADAYLGYLADTVLSRAACLVTLDRPGFGYSSGFGRAEGSLERQAAAAEAIRSRLAPGQKALLVGHSLGGPVLARFAMDYPEQVAGLVIVAGSIDPDLEEHPWWQAAVDAPPLRWLTPKSLWTSNREIKLLEAELRALLPLWAGIRCPVTVIHAEDDRLVPFGNVAFARRMLVNSARYREIILPKGDHFILWSRQPLIREAILDLLPARSPKQ